MKRRTILQAPTLLCLPALAVEPMPMTPGQFGQYIRADIQRWTALAKAKNIHLDE